MTAIFASVPVAVLTGFLGSGKSTLVNSLLRRGELPPTAVIVNEYGDIAIDHDLIEGVAEGVTLLGGGCVCCAVRSDLEATLRDLTLKSRRGLIPAFEAVLLETTGLAEPAPVLQTIGSGPMRQQGFQLGPVVTAVDAEHGRETLSRFDEAREQVAVADRLLMTKTDLVPPSPDLIAAVRALNPDAPMLSISPEASARAILGEQLFGTALLARPVQPGHRHHHTSDIDSTSFTLDEPLDWTRAQPVLRRFLQDHGPKILRLKAILALAGVDEPVAVHGVRHILYPPERLPRWPSEDRRSRLVVITQGLPPEIASELSASLAR